MRIRPATPADAPAMRAVLKSAWRTNYTHIYSAAQVEALFNGRLHQRADWVGQRAERLSSRVALVDDRVVGLIGLALLPDQFYREEVGGELDDYDATLVVFDPAAQGRGVGKALWQDGVRTLAERGCPRAWVWVLAKAEQAVHFYQRMGCEQQAQGTYSLRGLGKTRDVLGDHDEVALGYVLDLQRKENPT